MKKTPNDIQMLGPAITLEGSLVFEGMLVINGHVKGAIESREGTLVIGEQAVIHADIYVSNVKASGEIRGTIIASDRIELRRPARVYGDLTAPVVVIDAGVTFDGKCTTAPGNNAVKNAGNAIKKIPEGTAKTMEPSEKIKGTPNFPK